jgi:soluble lytic murein transglycosylase
LLTNFQKLGVPEELVAGLLRGLDHEEARVAAPQHASPLVGMQPPGYVTRMIARNYEPLRVQTELQSPDGKLRANAHRSAEGNAQLATLSFDHSFYGQLAMEELGTNIAPEPDSYRPSSDEIAAMEHVPGIQRALKFYQLGLRYEGALEWGWTTRGFGDKELLAAAEVARRNGWYERSIHTAERTRQLHDFALRYPTPYRDVVSGYARQLDLDEAWVYGLVRQESRFSVDARSSAGAVGLMQLMPTTARSVAKRLGIRGVDRFSVHTVDTNVSLGTYHLRQLMDGTAIQAPQEQR